MSMLRSPLGAPVRPLARKVTEAGGGWRARNLFSKGEDGFLMASVTEAFHAGRLFQDAAGTVPAAVNQPVCRIVDDSGRGHHLTQADATAGPTLKMDDAGLYYLLADGVNDCLAASFTYAAYPLTVAVAAKADANQQGSPVSCNNGSAAYHAIEKTTTANAWSAYDRNVSLLQATEAVGTNTEPHVLVAEFTSATVNLRADGTDPTAAITNTNGFGLTANLLVGQTRPGSLFFKGRIYGIIVLARAFTAAERLMVEAGLAAACGRITDTALMGKTIAFIGDSITEGGDYPERAAAKLGAVVRKYGFGGCRMAKHATTGDGPYYAPMCMHKLADYIQSGDYSALTAGADALFAYNGDDNRTQAAAFAAQNWAAVDYMVILFGTNDWAGDVPLGSDTDTTPDTFKGAVNHVLAKLSAAYPSMKVALVSPPFRSRRNPGDGLDSDTYPNTNGEYLVAFSDALKARGAAHTLPVFDAYRSSGIGTANAATYLVDGLHPTAPAGYQLIAERVAGFLSASY